MTMVIVEQSVNVALALADRAVFMEKGEIRFAGRPPTCSSATTSSRAVFLGGSES